MLSRYSKLIKTVGRDSDFLELELAPFKILGNLVLSSDSAPKFLSQFIVIKGVSSMEGEYTTTLRITLQFALQRKQNHMSSDSSQEPSFQFPSHKEHTRVLLRHFFIPS